MAEDWNLGSNVLQFMPIRCAPLDVSPWGKSAGKPNLSLSIDRGQGPSPRGYQIGHALEQSLRAGLLLQARSLAVRARGEGFEDNGHARFGSHGTGIDRHVVLAERMDDVG